MTNHPQRYYGADELHSITGSCCGYPRGVMCLFPNCNKQKPFLSLYMHFCTYNTVDTICSTWNTSRLFYEAARCAKNEGGSSS